MDNNKKEYIEAVRESVELYEAQGEHLTVELQELITVLIGYGATPEIAGRLAGYGIHNLVNMSKTELLNEGLAQTAVLQLYAACLLAKKLRASGVSKKNYTIKSEEDAANYLIPEMKHLTQEHLVVLLLNVKNQLIAKKTLTIGTLNSSICNPREVFKEALKHSAASIVLAHNHPSMNPEPSEADVEITLRLMEAGNLMGIPVMDHIIVGGENYVSLRRKGYV